LTESVAYVCPECGSPSVDIPTLAGGVASCGACRWAGKREQLVVFSFQQDFGSDVAIGRALAGDLRLVIAQLGLPFAQYLSKWGFLSGDAELAKRQLSRYLSAASRAILRAIIEERAAMEKERVSAS